MLKKPAELFLKPKPESPKTAVEGRGLSTMAELAWFSRAGSLGLVPK